MTYSSGAHTHGYRRIADDLRTAIRTGELKPGDAVPSETTLIDHYGVSRRTARAAVQLLRGEGLVDVAGPGQRTRVRVPRRRIRRQGSTRYQYEKDRVAKGGLPGDSHLAREEGLPVDQTEVRLLVDEVVPADHDLAQALEVGLGDDLRHYVFLLSAEGVPGRLAHHYYVDTLDAAVRLAQPMNAVNPQTPVIWPGGTMYQLAQLGIEIARVDDLVTARMPLPDEVEQLAMDEGVPLIIVRKSSYDTQGTPREVVDVLMPGDRTELLYRVPLRPWPDGPASLYDSDSE